MKLYKHKPPLSRLCLEVVRVKGQTWVTLRGSEQLRVAQEQKSLKIMPPPTFFLDIGRHLAQEAQKTT